ncbi:MAG: hypothetical protein JXA77_11215 [Bacteroidales bacterium]|nr:hypothetical protein [Bacteroidales bacterium]MBN2819062.1 hypothetical protein [Bacteroidales bacterium]
MNPDPYIGKFRNRKTGRTLTKFRKNEVPYLKTDNGDEFSLWVINELDKIGISIEVQGYEARLNKSIIWLKEPEDEEWEIYRYVEEKY